MSSDDIPSAIPPPPADTVASDHAWAVPEIDQLQSALPHLEIIALMGRGGMGAVFRARQRALDRFVAIKMLPREMRDRDAHFVERFKNEARVMARLGHPGIVTVHEFGETPDGQLYLVMELVEGGDLASLLSTEGKLPQERALAIASEVCEALACAHEHGVVHRDIKPANILITTKGRVKVADFGLAKLSDAEGLSGLTKTGTTMGTMDFVAPEALLLGNHTDARADLYALGVTLYQMLTGEIPRGLFLMPGVQSKGAIDPRLDHIITKAMQSNRESRYQTAEELRQDLDVILTTPRVKQDASKAVAAVPGQRSVAAQKPMGKVPQKPAERHASAHVAKSNTGLYIGLVAGIAVIGAVLFLFSGGRTASDETAGSQSAVTSPPAQGGPVKVAEPPKPPVARTVQFSPSTEPWVDALANPAALELKYDASRTSEWVRLRWGGGGLNGIASFPKLKGPDYAVRLLVEYVGTNKGPKLHFRKQDGKDYLFRLVPIRPTGFVQVVCSLPGQTKTEDVAKFRFAHKLQPGDVYQLEARIVGGKISVAFNGVAIGSAEDTTIPTGTVLIGGEGPDLLLRGVQYLDLSAPLPAGGGAGAAGAKPVVPPTGGLQRVITDQAATSAPAVFNAHRYQFVPDPALRWSEAKAKAEAMGGHLATITGQEENDWIARTFIQALPDERGVWIGGTRGKSGLWNWVTGEPFQYQNWLTVENIVGEPALLFLRTVKRGLGWADTSDIGIVGQNQDRDFRAGYLVEWDDPSKGTD